MTDEQFAELLRRLEVLAETMQQGNDHIARVLAERLDYIGDKIADLGDRGDDDTAAV